MNWAQQQEILEGMTFYITLIRIIARAAGILSFDMAYSSCDLTRRFIYQWQRASRKSTLISREGKKPFDSWECWRTHIVSPAITQRRITPAVSRAQWPERGTSEGYWARLPGRADGYPTGPPTDPYVRN